MTTYARIKSRTMPDLNNPITSKYTQKFFLETRDISANKPITKSTWVKNVFESYTYAQRWAHENGIILTGTWAEACKAEQVYQDYNQRIYRQAIPQHERRARREAKQQERRLKTQRREYESLFRKVSDEEWAKVAAELNAANKTPSQDTTTEPSQTNPQNHHTGISTNSSQFNYADDEPEQVDLFTRPD